MQRTQEEFAAADVYGGSPDGLVRATMRSGKLAALTIDPTAMGQDSTRLAAQVLAAVQDCEVRSAELLMRRTGPMNQAMEKVIGEIASPPR
ncbi:YbaB/EbfC family nucleoid-associated protein [Micromonospora pisi]|nr:YbaB/EbfC family nucleoid-associated protein [Micromonospora pisi]